MFISSCNLERAGLGLELASMLDLLYVTIWQPHLIRGHIKGWLFLGEHRVLESSPRGRCMLMQKNPIASKDYVTDICSGAQRQGQTPESKRNKQWERQKKGQNTLALFTQQIFMWISARNLYIFCTKNLLIFQMSWIFLFTDLKNASQK